MHIYTYLHIHVYIYTSTYSGFRPPHNEREEDGEERGAGTDEVDVFGSESEKNACQ